MKDENGKDMSYVVKLSKTGSGDERTFTFHPSNMPAAEHYLESTVKIALNLEIKEYRVDTTINRTRASGDSSATGNDTAVRVRIRDKNNEQIIVNGVLQSDGMFVQGAIPEVMTAQHHGFMLYTFTTPEGYMLTKFTVNGFTLDDTLTLDSLTELAENGGISRYIKSVDTVLGVYPEITVTDAQSKRFSNGGALAFDRLKNFSRQDGLFRVYSPDRRFLGLGLSNPTKAQLEVARLYIP